jgi:hypothetical protein
MIFFECIYELMQQKKLRVFIRFIDIIQSNMNYHKDFRNRKSSVDAFFSY